MATSTLTDALRSTLDVFEDAGRGVPLTTSEVTDSVDVGRRSTYDRLNRLVEGGHLETKEVGARGRVWWRPPTATGPAERDETEGSYERTDDVFQSIFEHSNDAIYINDPKADEIVDVNEAGCEMLGYTREELLSIGPSDCHPDEMKRFRSFVEDVFAEGAGWTDELTCLTKDGRRLPTEMSASRIVVDGRELLVAIVRDISERTEQKRELERQREHLATLDKLHCIGREITDAAMRQPSRDEIERTVCEVFAESDSYAFAWMAEVDPTTEDIEERVEAGVDGYLADISLSTNPEDPTGQGPTGRAIRTQEVVTTGDVFADPDFEPWRDAAREYGYRAAAAIPVVHEGTMYGIVGVYTTRENAFPAEECRTLASIGETVGHAIAAIERKRALMSDEVVKLDFRIADLFDTFGVDAPSGCRVTIDETVPTTDDDFLVYGDVSGGGIDTLRALVDAFPAWESASLLGDADADATRFQVQVSEPPVLSAIASKGGRVEEAVLEDGDYYMTYHLSPGVDTRDVIDTVQDAYPSTEMVTRRRIQRPDDAPSSSNVLCGADLTERQRTALEAAFFGGFFEWPRESSGEDVADAMGVSPPTLHEHLRTAQRKVFETLLASESPVDHRASDD